MVMIYKCPYCGAEMKFNEATGLLHCDYCDSDCSVDEFRIQSAEEFASQISPSRLDEQEHDGYVCNNCGARIITDGVTSATFCSFCGAPTIIPTRITGVAKPDLILPFTVDRRDAQAAFTRWFGKKKLIPNGFYRTAAAGRISGIYVPFWLYDCQTETLLHAKSTETQVAIVGDTEHTTVTTRSHFRHIETSYRGIPVDASEKMDDRLMDLLEPFDYGGLTAFDPAYMSGFLAEKYSYTAEQTAERVKARADAYGEQAAMSCVKANGPVTVTDCSHVYKDLTSKYALLPVWTINYTYRGFTYQFFMNGQTGKIVGQPPLSAGKSFAWFAGIAAAAAAIGEIIILAVDML